MLIHGGWGVVGSQGKRRYDRKQQGYGGQTKPILHKKVGQSVHGQRSSSRSPAAVSISDRDGGGP